MTWCIHEGVDMWCKWVMTWNRQRLSHHRLRGFFSACPFVPPSFCRRRRLLHWLTPCPRRRYCRLFIQLPHNRQWDYHHTISKNKGRICSVFSESPAFLIGWCRSKPGKRKSWINQLIWSRYVWTPPHFSWWRERLCTRWLQRISQIFFVLFEQTRHNTQRRLH